MSNIIVKNYPIPIDGVPKTKCNWNLKLGDCFTINKILVLKITTLNDKNIELNYVGNKYYISGLLCYFNHWANDVGLQRT